MLCVARPHAVHVSHWPPSPLSCAGEPNISYICSRYYRAPELIFGAVDYTVAIDVSAAGSAVDRGRGEARVQPLEGWVVGQGRSSGRDIRAATRS